MLEKDLEELLIMHPELIEEGIIFKGNQVNLEGKYLDLLFEDNNGQKLIVEVKLIARRKDIAQLIDYAGYFIGKNIPIRAMLVALRIPTNYRHSFDYWGFEYRELQESTIAAMIPNGAGKESMNQAYPVAKQSTSDQIVSSSNETLGKDYPFQTKRNLTRQNMASRIRKGGLFNQARHAIEFLNKSSLPISMKEFTDYMKSINYKSRSYYDLFNALCDSGLVKRGSENGYKVYSLVDD